MPFLPFLSNPFQSGFCSRCSTKPVLSKSQVPFPLLSPMVSFQSLSHLPCLQHATQRITPCSFKHFPQSVPMIPQSRGFLATPTGHSLSVGFAGCFSSPQSLTLKAQGSVLGPLLFYLNKIVKSWVQEGWSFWFTGSSPLLWTCLGHIKHLNK